MNEKGMKEKQKGKSTVNGNTQSGNNNKDSISNELITQLEEEIKKLEIEKK